MDVYRKYAPKQFLANPIYIYINPIQTIAWDLKSANEDVDFLTVAAWRKSRGHIGESPQSWKRVVNLPQRLTRVTGME